MGDDNRVGQNLTCAPPSRALEIRCTALTLLQSTTVERDRFVSHLAPKGLRCRKAQSFEKDSVEARNRPILEFPLSMSHREVAKILQAEGWFSLKTTVYYIEYRVRRLREKRRP